MPAPQEPEGSTSGWFAVSRGLTNQKHDLHPFTSGEPACRGFAWVDLIGLAAFEATEKLEIGQLEVSQRFLATRWRWSRPKVQRFLKKLTDQGRISPIHQPIHQPIHLTICKYETYQQARSTNRSTNRSKDNNSNKTTTTISSETRLVFGYWKEARKSALGLNGDGPAMKLTKKRASKVKARLDEGYTTEQLCRAVDGCLGNDFNREGGHTDLELICRDQQHVEQYLAWSAGRSGTQDDLPTL